MMLTKEQIIAEGEDLLRNRTFYTHDDRTTWYGFFDKFATIEKDKESRLLKIIWATYICKKKGNAYNLNESQVLFLAKMAPDYCPIMDTPIDYGVGLNSVINPNNTGYHSYYQPSIDHIIPSTNGGTNNIDNYVIVSYQANKIKNNHFTTKEELDSFYKNMQKTYFEKKIANDNN